MSVACCVLSSCNVTSCKEISWHWNGASNECELQDMLPLRVHPPLCSLTKTIWTIGHSTNTVNRHDCNPIRFEGTSWRHLLASSKSSLSDPVSDARKSRYRCQFHHCLCSFSTALHHHDTHDVHWGAVAIKKSCSYGSQSNPSASPTLSPERRCVIWFDILTTSSTKTGRVSHCTCPCRIISPGAYSLHHQLKNCSILQLKSWPIYKESCQTSKWPYCSLSGPGAIVNYQSQVILVPTWRFWVALSEEPQLHASVGFQLSNLSC